MPAVVRIHTLADAPPTPAAVIEAAVARLNAGAELVHACAACGSSEIVYDSVESRTGVWTETTTDEGWACKRCGAFEADCDELVVMPAAAFAELTAAYTRGA